MGHYCPCTPLASDAVVYSVMELDVFFWSQEMRLPFEINSAPVSEGNSTSQLSFYSLRIIETQSELLLCCCV